MHFELGTCAPRAAARGGSRHPRETSLGTQRALSDEQERDRVEGLRILARIIACHTLARTELSEDAPGDEGPQPPLSAEGATGGPPERTDDAA